MSFLDKITKAVSDTVDRGKKEVDEFMRIQKVKGEIGEAEARIQEARRQIQQTTLQIGEKALAMVRAGALAEPELQALAEPLTGFERQIDEQNAVIAAKKQEIERIKAEGGAAGVAVPPVPIPTAEVVQPPASPVPPVAPPVPPLPLPAIDETATAPPPVPGPAVAPARSVCPACGTQVGEGAAFCLECGAKLR
jgi:hypothetical protein